MDIYSIISLTEKQVASFLQRKNARNAAYQQYAIATAAQTFKVGPPLKQSKMTKDTELN